MGIAEVCEGQSWTCICGDDVTQQHGELICSQLGLPGLYRYSTGPAQCTSGGWDNIKCNEDATSFQDCIHSISTTFCTQVHIECYSEFTHNHK